MSEILAVSANTINYSSSTPIPKIYFDALTGGYILTKETTMIPKDLFMNLVSLFDFELIFKKFKDIRRLNYENTVSSIAVLCKFANRIHSYIKTMYEKTTTLEVEFRQIFKRFFSKRKLTSRDESDIYNWAYTNIDIGYYIINKKTTTRFLKIMDSIKRIVKKLVKEHNVATKENCFDDDTINSYRIPFYFFACISPIDDTIKTRIEDETNEQRKKVYVEEDCCICLELLAIEETQFLTCGHYMHKSCLRDYLIKLSAKSEVTSIHCPICRQDTPIENINERLNLDMIEHFESVNINPDSLDPTKMKLLLDFCECIKNDTTSEIDEWIANKEEYTGHDLFSFLLPFDFTYNGGGGVKIDQGVMLHGILSDKCLGQKPNSIIVYLNKNYSQKVALDFVTNYQKLMNSWLSESGFSVGLGDCIQESNTFEKGIKDIVAMNVIKADSRGNNEQQVIDVLSSAMNTSSKLVQEAVNERKNSLMDMISSGAKGKLDNLCQISAIVGRQDKDGHLIKEGFDDRTLPCYRRRRTIEEKLSFSIRDIHLKAEEQGFISSSFMSGLNAREFWFHASSGRDGIINTAIRTADVGYSTRSLSKYLEDVHINSAGMVVNQADQVISLDFGYDASRGLDSGKCIIVNGEPQFCDFRSIVEKIRANKKREEAETEYKVIKDE